MIQPDEYSNDLDDHVYATYLVQDGSLYFRGLFSMESIAVMAGESSMKPYEIFKYSSPVKIREAEYVDIHE